MSIVASTNCSMAKFRLRLVPLLPVNPSTSNHHWRWHSHLKDARSPLKSSMTQEREFLYTFEYIPGLFAGIQCFTIPTCTSRRGQPTCSECMLPTRFLCSQ